MQICHTIWTRIKTNGLLKKRDAEIRNRGTRGRGIHVRCHGSEVRSAESKVHLGLGLLLCVRVQQCGGRQSQVPAQAGTSKK